MKTTIEECKDFFESIMCLCVEGPEFHTKMELVDIILAEATNGYNLCKSVEQADSADAETCERCGYPKSTHPRTTCWGEEG